METFKFQLNAVQKGVKGHSKSHYSTVLTVHYGPSTPPGPQCINWFWNSALTSTDSLKRSRSVSPVKKYWHQFLFNPLTAATRKIRNKSKIKKAPMGYACQSFKDPRRGTPLTYATDNTLNSHFRYFSKCREGSFHRSEWWSLDDPDVSLNLRAVEILDTLKDEKFQSIDFLVTIESFLSVPSPRTDC